MANASIWRDEDCAIANGLAFGYVLAGQSLGITLMAWGHAPGWVAGVLLTGHSLVVAGYLIHELAHMGVFRHRKPSIAVGEILSWICGAAYAPFERIQRMHLRHHRDRADVSLFDPRPFIARSSDWFRKLVYALEWCYIPAVELIMHYQVVVRPFINRKFATDRGRVIFVGISRLWFFAFLFWLSPWVLLGYACAYMIFLTALFVADAYAHTYEYYPVEAVNQPVPGDGRDGAYDRAHTYSNLISERWPWLNLLNLNFGYHSAHHDQPSTPWYRLPKLHSENYAGEAPQVMPYRELWRSFRINRLKRIEADDAGSVGSGPGRVDDFLGVHGVSFLSIV